MNKTRIATLNKQLEAFQEEYITVAIDYVTFKDKYIDKMHKLGDEIHAIQGEIRRLRMPVDVEE